MMSYFVVGVETGADVFLLRASIAFSASLGSRNTKLLMVSKLMIAMGMSTRSSSGFCFLGSLMRINLGGEISGSE